MDQAMQQLIGVIGGMQPNEVKAFILEIFSKLPVPDQDELYQVLGKAMQVGGEQMPSEAPQAPAAGPAVPPVDMGSMF